MGRKKAQRLLLATVLALIAALAGALADVLLLYHPAGGYTSGDYAFLSDIPWPRLVAGHYIGLLAIPLELCGFWLIYEGLKPAGRKPAIWLLALVAYLFFPGVAYHATVAFTAIWLQTGEALDPAAAALLQEGMPLLIQLFEPLGLLFSIGFLAVSILFAWLVLARRTAFPRWLGICNPGVFYLSIMAVYWFYPPLGNLLLPAGFNLSIFLFLLLALVTVRWPLIK